MKRYTFVMDFEGGTYLSQVSAGSPEEALSGWAKNMNWNEVAGAEGISVPEVMEELIDEALSPIEGLVNVWCFTISPREKLGIVHVVES